jgi:GWxTD domain-containing protein
MRRTFYIQTLLLLSTFSFSQIQPLDRVRPVQNPEESEWSPVYYEALNFPAEVSEKSRVDIMYRISHSFFIFVKNEQFVSLTDTSEDRRWPFIAQSIITAELLNPSGISVARELIRRELGTTNPERDRNKNEFLQGIFSFTLPPDEYTIVFYVNDLESNQEFLDKSKKVQLRDFTQKPIGISDVVFLEPIREHSESTEFIPVNLAGNVFFGRNFNAYIEVACADSLWERLQLRYSLYKLNPPPERDSTFFIRDSLVREPFTSAKTLSAQRAETTSPLQMTAAYRIEEPKGLIRKRGTFLQLDGETLPQGEYGLTITITNGNLRQTQVHPFRVRWVDMPRSLLNIDFAITVLEYIASKEEYSELKGAFTRNRQKKFEEFWKKHDPTPNTALNEAMAEYYRRVDYTMENFSGSKSPDGWKSDRGKTYILYGKPSNVERKFSPTAPPREVWTYDNVKRRFIFVDESRNGNYKLVATEHL